MPSSTQTHHQETLPPSQIPALLIPPKTLLPADRNPALVYLASLPSPRSRTTVASALTTIARLIAPGASLDLIPWHLLRYQHTAAIRAILIDRFSPATVNLYLTALRRVLHHAWLLDLLPVSDYQRAISIKAVRFQALPKGRRVPAGELRALFEAAARRKPPANARDAALLALLYGGGLRSAEAVALDLDHFRANERLVEVLKGKGRKDRRVPLPGGAVLALQAWLRQRGESPGPLLWPVRKGGGPVCRRLQPRTVNDLIVRLGKAAAIPPLSPHDLRRSFLSDLLDADVDVLAASRLAGHASPVTTRRYDLRGEESDRNAVERIHVPFGGD